MSDLRDIAPSSDDTNLLRELLAAVPSKPQHAPLRPAQLRSISQERHVALKGYRFRTIFDFALFRIERVLMLVMIGFFSFWIYDSYVRDWLHDWRNPPAQQVQWDEIPVGASAEELDLALGSTLPISAPAGDDADASPGAPIAQAPDYMVPAEAFVIPPPAPTATPEAPHVSLQPLSIIVPAMQLNSPIREVFLRDGIWEVADYAVGYHNGTAYPGHGNTVLAGHAGLRGGVFAQLGGLKPGDDVYLQTATTRFHYQVQGVRNVWPNQVEVMYPTAEPIITMITCTTWDTQRLVVTAILVDQAPLSSSLGGVDSTEAA